MGIMGRGTPPEKRLNVILFMLDDLGSTDLTGYGSELYQTPNLNLLAENGMRFINAYAASTVCSPSRPSLMTT